MADDDVTYAISSRLNSMSILQSSALYPRPPFFKEDDLVVKTYRIPEDRREGRRKLVTFATGNTVGNLPTDDQVLKVLHEYFGPDDNVTNVRYATSPVGSLTAAASAFIGDIKRNLPFDPDGATQSRAQGESTNFSASVFCFDPQDPSIFSQMSLTYKCELEPSTLDQTEKWWSVDPDGNIKGGPNRI